MQIPRLCGTEFAVLISIFKKVCLTFFKVLNVFSNYSEK